MPEPTAIHSTFVLERAYAASPERVFAAFSSPAKKRRWFIEGDHHDVEHFSMDFRAGGRETARYLMKPGTPIAGMTLVNETVYQDIVPNRRIVSASAMSLDGRCFSASLVTIELLPSEAGTALICTHQGAFFEGADGPAMREAGWNKLLDNLTAKLPLNEEEG